ncbi:DUF5329 family protein [Pontibacter chinhatensis]|uniref:DUF5329 domain-containing protein n=1 Tax=Pontibacter chinhatensis TaxID=1436961 RepID=A0A1I2VA80_9BACT|nr:DUF5329 family protein [Pontibacter chinhatensis]SFG86274.1 hypothetical protein SAMN05421739_104111 [Pontibacter chinhatensis]
MKTKSKACVLLSFILCTGFLSLESALAQSATAVGPQERTTKLTEDEKVERLIQHVAKMEGATFIRNGSEHTCRQAAEHLESKWEKHRDSVKTARDFIAELASRSGLSGKDYLIRFADGTTRTTNEVLMAELELLEQ